MRGLQTLLARDCEVTMIPSGERAVIPAGTEVRVLQTLGGNVTVQGDYGQLMRIDEKDVDVLGEGYEKQEKQSAEPSADAGTFDPERVWEQLRTVFVTTDPALPGSLRAYPKVNE